MLQNLIFSFLTLISSGDEGTTTYTASVAESKVEWIAEKVTGKHNGTVSLKSGDLKFKDGALTGGSFVIDMTTIDCNDLSGEWKDKLVGHLKSDDFFSVEKFGTSKFAITKVVPQGPGKYKVIGDLTIKGITNSIQFNTTVEEVNGSYVSKASIVVDRSKFNVKYGSGSFFDDLGDKTIYDEFTINVELVSKK